MNLRKEVARRRTALERELRRDEQRRRDALHSLAVELGLSNNRVAVREVGILADRLERRGSALVAISQLLRELSYRDLEACELEKESRK